MALAGGRFCLTIYNLREHISLHLIKGARRRRKGGVASCLGGHGVVLHLSDGRAIPLLDLDACMYSERGWAWRWQMVCKKDRAGRFDRGNIPSMRSALNLLGGVF